MTKAPTLSAPPASVAPLLLCPRAAQLQRPQLLVPTFSASRPNPPVTVPVALPASCPVVEPLGSAIATTVSACRPSSHIAAPATAPCSTCSIVTALPVNLTDAAPATAPTTTKRQYNIGQELIINSKNSAVGSTSLSQASCRFECPASCSTKHSGTECCSGHKSVVTLATRHPSRSGKISSLGWFHMRSRPLWARAQRVTAHEVWHVSRNALLLAPRVQCAGGWTPIGTVMYTNILGAAYGVIIAVFVKVRVD